MRTGSLSSAEPSTPSTPIAEPVLSGIESHLRQRELRREELYQQARKLRRLAQATIARLHSGGPADDDLATIRRLLAELSEAVRHERGGESVALDAFQEAVEACLLGSILRQSPLPTPSDLGVDPEPFLLGLGDVIGEVRRLVLDRLGREDLVSAERHLVLMQGLAEALLRFDPARGILALKPKQDQARLLVERTRGEVVMARLLLQAQRPSGPAR